MSNPRSRRGTRLTAGGAVLALLVSMLVVAIGSTLPAGAAFTTACSGATDTHFTDHPGTAANCLFDYGIAKGKADGTFGEDDNLIRSQFASFVTRLLDAAGVAHTARTTFPDVNSGSVPNPDVLKEIEEGHAAGVVNGFSAQSGPVVNGQDCSGSPCVAGDFGPGFPMSVAQAATIILQMMDAIHAANPAAPAGNASGDPATDYDTAVSMGILDLSAKDASGTTYPNGKTDTIKRGLFADMLAQTVQKEVDAGVITNVYTASNQTFPSDVTTAQVITNNTSGVGQKTVTFTGLTAGSQVDIALAPCWAVTQSGSNVVFVDNFNADGLFPNVGSTSNGEAVITDIDGINQNTDYMDNYTLPSNTLVVRVGNQFNANTGDCLRVVVWTDNPDDNQVSVDNTNMPTEPIGVTAPIVFTRGESPNNSSYDGTVDYVDHSGAGGHLGWFLLSDGYQYFFDASDTPFYNDSFGVTPATFASAVSPSDSLDNFNGGYSQTGPNSFDLYDDEGYPAGVPTGVTATTGDFDTNPADTGANDIKVSWTPPAGDISPDHYCVDLYNTQSTTTRNDDTYAGLTECTNNSTPSDHDVVFVDVPAGPYLAYAYTISGTNSDSPYANPAAVTQSAPLVGAPFSTSAVFQDTDTNGAVSNTDILTVTFNEDMNTPGAGDKFSVMDADGTVATIVCGTNATCAEPVAGTLTFTLTAGPIVSTAGSTPGAQYGSSVVVSSTGNTDAGDNHEWNLAASTDKTF